MLTVADVTKTFGNNMAVDSATLDVGPGERLCLVGPNGAGKTTLMRMIIGMTRPTSGTVLLFGEDPVKSPEIRRHIGYVSDTPFLYDKLTGGEHLKLHAALYGLPREGIVKKGTRLLERLEMVSTGGQRVETFSFGMRKKLALVLALVHGPDLLVLDEPLNGLDPESSDAVAKLLERLALEDGRALVLSTHDMDFAARFAARVGVMRAGRLTLHALPAGSSAEEVVDLFRGEGAHENVY